MATTVLTELELIEVEVAAARLLGCARASVAAARLGEATPLAYVRARLTKTGLLPPPQLSPRQVLAEADECVQRICAHGCSIPEVHLAYVRLLGHCRAAIAAGDVGYLHQHLHQLGLLPAAGARPQACLAAPVPDWWSRGAP